MSDMMHEVIMRFETADKLCANEHVVVNDALLKSPPTYLFRKTGHGSRQYIYAGTHDGPGRTVLQYSEIEKWPCERRRKQ